MATKPISNRAQDTLFYRLDIPVTLSPDFQAALRSLDGEVYVAISRKWGLTQVEDQMVREAVAEAAVRAGITSSTL